MTEFKFTREWFNDKKNQVHTEQDNKLFGRTDDCKEIKIGEHFLVDLYPIYENGENRSPTDVEIWEVENIKIPIFHKIRGCKLPLKAIRKVTTGKQFGYPNGYWRVPWLKEKGKCKNPSQNGRKYRVVEE